MAIDFTFSPEVDEVRAKVRDYCEQVVRPVERRADAESWGRNEWKAAIIDLRRQAREWGVYLPHMPTEYGGMGLGHVAMAAVSAEAGRTRVGPLALNAQAPDEGNMHTLLHWATDDQKERYLRPLCEGRTRSCFAMTEPEVAGSDPTLIQTRAYADGDEWVINGHKWYISGARGARFAIVIARTEDDPDLPQAANTAFIVDVPTEGWEVVRDIQTMSGRHNHCEIRLTDVRVHERQMLGGRGQGHLLGQYRLGPARLAHCMRWIGQTENALEMMVDRALNRYAHGSLLAEKQGIQWLIAESAIELYQAKLMVLHCAYLIDRKLEFRNESSMAKFHVANTLWKVVDRAIQVHGALGYSTDTPLAQTLMSIRSSRLVDGSDEVHKMRIAQKVIAAYKDHGTTRAATGNLPL